MPQEEPYKTLYGFNENFRGPSFPVTALRLSHSSTVSSVQIFVLAFNQELRKEQSPLWIKTILLPLSEPLVPLATNLQEKCKAVPGSQNQSKTAQNAKS